MIGKSKFSNVMADWNLTIPLFKNTVSHQAFFCKSCPDTQAQNGIAEHKHKHILEMVCTFLIQSLLPSSYWAEAACVAFLQ